MGAKAAREGGGAAETAAQGHMGHRLLLTQAALDIVQYPVDPGGMLPAMRRVGHEQPVVPPQVRHLRQVPLRTRVRWPHTEQGSPS